MSNSTPATSSQLFTKRRRAFVACITCRQRKIKCTTVSDADYQPCTRCVEKGIKCEYQSVTDDDDYSSTPSPDVQGPSRASGWHAQPPITPPSAGLDLAPERRHLIRQPEPTLTAPTECAPLDREPTRSFPHPLRIPSHTPPAIHEGRPCRIPVDLHLSFTMPRPTSSPHPIISNPTARMHPTDRHTYRNLNPADRRTNGPKEFQRPNACAHLDRVIVAPISMATIADEPLAFVVLFLRLYSLPKTFKLIVSRSFYDLQ
ncbi:hypothetical protein DFH09DRAFT_1508408 [Mycena vulgaris]|nr:hypothetical protein DFH09DRAFT_1508408 [Mycena vulgaris]